MPSASSIVRSILDPDSLGPKEREETDLVSQWLGPDTGGISHRLFKTLADPWIIGSLAASIAFPIGSAKTLTQVSKKLGLLERTFLPGVTKLLPFGNIFRGHKIKGETQALVRSINQFKDKHTGVFNTAIFNFEKRVGRTLTRQDHILVGMDLDGLVRPGNPTLKAFGLESAFGTVRLPSELRVLSTEIRTGLNAVWDETLGTKAGRKAIQELKGMMKNQGFEPDDGVGFIRQFFPHQIVRSEFGAFIDPRAVAQTTRVGAKTLTKERLVRMLPSLDDVRSVEQYLRPGAVQALERTLAVKPVRQYSLDAMRVIPRYLGQVAKTNAFSIEGHGKLIDKSIRELKVLAAKGSGNADLAVRIMEQNIIPAIKETRTPSEGIAAAIWTSTKAGTIKALDTAINRFGTGATGNFLRETRRMIGEADAGAASRKLAGFFYLNLLGGNIGTAVRNLAQPALTTGPVLGFGTTIKGMQEAFEQSTKYFKLRAAKVPKHRAFEQAFPRFAKSGIAPDVLSEEIRQSLESSWLAVKSPGLGKAADQVKAAMMGFFTGSERFNRIVTFNAAIKKAVRDGIKGEAAQNAFAAEIVDITQFTGGPLGTPIGTLGLNPLLRQFTTFPIRFGEFFGSTATALGSAERAIPGNIPFISGRNFGTLGRTVLAGRLIQQGGQHLLGTDLSDFTFQGALPIPRGFGALGALPFAPPALSLAASASVDLANREFNQTRFAIPSLIPGGAGLARGIGFSGLPYSEGISRTLGRKFVDYEDADEEGKIPLYNGKGSLLMRISPWQAYTMGAGIPVGDVQREQQMMQVVASQKDRIRAERKQYADALNSNDSSRALAIKERFQGAFGFELRMRPQDLAAAAMRKKTTRLQRQIQSLPSDARAPVEQALRMWAAQQVSVFAESDVDPLLLQAPTQPRAASARRADGGVEEEAPVRGRGRAGAARPAQPQSIGPELFGREPQSAF